METVIDTTPECETEAAEKPQRNSSRLQLIHKMRILEEESLAQCRGIMRKIKVALIQQGRVNNDIKNAVSEIEEQFYVMERYRKSWKAAVEERSEQILTGTTEVRTTEHRAESAYQDAAK